MSFFCQCSLVFMILLTNADHYLLYFNQNKYEHSFFYQWTVLILSRYSNALLIYVTCIQFQNSGEDMTKITKITIILFKLILFILLVFMVYEQLKIYISNDDVSSLLYKKFKHHQQDVYPTFSVCIVLYDGILFQHALGNLSKPYWNFIRGAGKRDDYEEKFLNFKYEQVVMDVRNMFQKYQRKSKGMNGKTTTQKFFEFETVFQVSHQNPNRICFTKKEVEEDPQLIKYDLLKLRYQQLPLIKSECHVYIHHKGQLIRSLTKPTILLFGKQLANGKLKGNQGFQYVLRMRSNAMEVLRRRPDANYKCNITLKDDDSKWRQTIFEENQCIPAFMERFVQDEYNHYPECNFSQHKKVVYDYSPYDDFEAAAKLYSPPCSEIGNIVTTNEDVTRFDDENVTNLILKFEYSKDYRETVNARSFNVYDLWSQIGGVVGIIVGYNMAQIPDALENFIKKGKSLFGTY